MVLSWPHTYPTIAFVTANPLIIIFLLVVVLIYLLAELTVPVIVIIGVACVAEKAVFTLLHPRTDLAEYAFLIAFLIETLTTLWHLGLELLFVARLPGLVLRRFL